MGMIPRCRCDRGFQLGLKGECEDVDECQIRFDICKNGRCKNTKGGFTCQCTDGFTLSAGNQFLICSERIFPP